MEPDDLEKMFAKMDVPPPDSERRKETLNLSVAAFEAQKSALSKNNRHSRQGSSWLSRLIRQVTTKKENDMTDMKKVVYGGLIGGLMTACVALLVYQGPLNLSNAVSTENLSVADAAKVQQWQDELNAYKPMKKAETSESLVTAQADVMEEPGASAVSPAMQQAIEDKNVDNVQEAARSGGSALPVPTMPSKGALPVPAEMAANIAAAPAPMVMAKKMTGNALVMPRSIESFTPVMENEGRDKFSHVDQNSIVQVKAQPVSTFSIDVDTASYAFARQNLDNGLLPQKDSVRIEEMVNYFDYAYPAPESKDEPFKTSIVVKPSPWNDGKKLITIGIKGYDVQKAQAPDSNLVFLIDTSGSMNEPKKLPLLKQSLTMLLDSLKPTDKVSIVVYAGAAGTVLQPTPVSDKGTILQALQNLSAGGSTAGGEGIRLAYQQAQSNFNKDAVNRVILATDGDFNVGITEPNELQGFIERMREKGIFLSVLGFGQGNYNDDLMQKLAQNGNGVAAYIDTLNEARKVLVQEASATLFPIAKDVKIQVEFNPSTVSEYRLVGYETRALKTEDFNNDKVDAGDIGAGAEVTAMYEVTPVGATPTIDPSRYGQQSADEKPAIDKNAELAFVKIRYKLPKEDTSKLITTPVSAAQETADPVLTRETNWAEAVAGFAQLMKGGNFTGKLTYDDVIKQAEANKGDDPFGYRAEFINLVYKAKTAAAMPANDQPQGGPVAEPFAQ